LALVPAFFPLVAGTLRSVGMALGLGLPHFMGADEESTHDLCNVEVAATEKSRHSFDHIRRRGRGANLYAAMLQSNIVPVW
jgi:hypothetical protein